MNVLTRLGIAAVAVSLSYSVVTAMASQEPDGVVAAGGGSVVPERSQADVAMVAAALGGKASDVVAKTHPLAKNLQVPAGADSMQEGLWHLAANKWGSVRVYSYPRPVDVAPRHWRSPRAFKGSAAPHFAMDYYGVVGLREISVYVDAKGRVVAVQPTDYEGLSDVTMESNPDGETEAGD